MVAAVVLTGSVAWTFGAFSAAAVLVLAVAFVVTPMGGSAGATPVPGRRVLEYLLPLAGYAFLLNLLLQADVIGVKASLGGLHQAFGGEGFDGGAADRASGAAGVYGAAKNVAMLPYQAVISLTFVVFPLVSRAASLKDRVAADAAVGGAMRLAAVLSCAAAAVLAAAPGELLGLLFGEAYVAGAGVLAPLLGAVTLLALMHVGNAVLASAGSPWVSLGGGGVAVGVQLALIVAAGASPGGESDVQAVAAWATLAGTASGAAVTLWFLRRAFATAAWVRTACLSVLAAAAGLVAAWAVGGPGGARVVVSTSVFAASLGLTGAVSRADVSTAMAVFRRRPR